MPVIQVTYSNGSKATMLIDPPDIRKVTIDHGRPLDIRVRTVFKSTGTPLDLFFHKPNAPTTVDQSSPLVSNVAVFTDAEPVSLADPDMVYGTISNWMRFAQLDALRPCDIGTSRDRGTKAPQE